MTLLVAHAYRASQPLYKVLRDSSSADLCLRVFHTGHSRLAASIDTLEYILR
jgi:hypothetical protein